MARDLWCAPPAEGEVFNGVLQSLEILDVNLVKARHLGSGTICLIQSSLEPGCLYTVYGFRLVDVELQLLSPSPTACVIPASLCDECSSFRIVEVCSGIGGIGVGAEFCDFQGDQAGFADTRSSAFWGTLRAAYLCQVRFLVLECTPGAGRDAILQRALHEFAQVLGLQLHQLFFNLASQWPTQRMRWWAVLYPQDWPALKLSDWTGLSDPMVMANLDF
eukprot:s153_g41.t1